LTHILPGLISLPAADRFDVREHPYNLALSSPTASAEENSESDRTVIPNDGDPKNTFFEAFNLNPGSHFDTTLPLGLVASIEGSASLRRHACFQNQCSPTDEDAFRERLTGSQVVGPVLNPAP
jgi:hypothetical protein